MVKPEKKIDTTASVTPVILARRRLDPDARREQLLEHAFSAFAEAGIERAVHADVALRAGVSTPTVFKYFPTRDALVNAVLDRVQTTLIDLIECVPDNSNIEPAEITRLWALALNYLCETQPNLMKVGLCWSVAFSPIRDRYQSFENLMLDMLKSRMKDAVTDRSDARILVASATLYIRMHFDGSSKDARNRYIERMSEILAAAPDHKR